MTKVMHIINGLDAGGAESVLARIVAHNANSTELRQVVISLMNEGVYGADIRATGTRLYTLGLCRGVSGLPAGIIKLTRIMRSEKPDAVMSWLYHSDFITTVATFFSGVGLRRLAWNIRCAEMDLKQYGESTRLVFKCLGAMSSFPAIVAVNSRAGKKHHAKNGYKPKLWAYLPNGFDCDEWKPDNTLRNTLRSELQVRRETSLIGMVARKDPAKDHSTLFKALEICSQRGRDIHLVLVGRETESLPIPFAIHKNVTALGLRRDVAKIVPGFDIAVLSSTFGEGFPNVVGEAMACGVPVVGNDVGDVAEIVGDTGKTVPLASAGKMADAICELLDEPNEAKQARRAAARQRILEHYSLQSMNTNYRSLWNALAAKQDFSDLDLLS